MKKQKPLTVQTILEIAQKATDQTERVKMKSLNAYYLKLLKTMNVEKVVSVADIAEAVTVSNHLNSLLDAGKNDIFDKLVEYINSTSLSLHRYREIAKVAKSVDMNAIDALIEGRISSNQFITQIEIPQSKVRSVDEIYSDLRNINSTHENHLNNTADLFNNGVDYIEEIMQRILSPEYINTFDETDKKSKAKIADCLDRLDQIHTVISSLI